MRMALGCFLVAAISQDSMQAVIQTCIRCLLLHYLDLAMFAIFVHLQKQYAAQQSRQHSMTLQLFCVVHVSR